MDVKVVQKRQWIRKTIVGIGKNIIHTVIDRDWSDHFLDEINGAKQCCTQALDRHAQCR